MDVRLAHGGIDRRAITTKPQFNSICRKPVWTSQGLPPFKLMQVCDHLHFNITTNMHPWYVQTHIFILGRLLRHMLLHLVYIVQKMLLHWHSFHAVWKASKICCIGHEGSYIM